MGLRLRLSIHLCGHRYRPRLRYIFFEKNIICFFQSQIFFCTFAFGNDKTK